MAHLAALVTVQAASATFPQVRCCPQHTTRFSCTGSCAAVFFRHSLAGLTEDDRHTDKQCPCVHRFAGCHDGWAWCAGRPRGRPRRQAWRSRRRRRSWWPRWPRDGCRWCWTLMIGNHHSRLLRLTMQPDNRPDPNPTLPACLPTVWCMSRQAQHTYMELTQSDQGLLCANCHMLHFVSAKVGFRALLQYLALAVGELDICGPRH
jgi:hypothetical protein